MTTEGPARGGETCRCGRPAVVVFVAEQGDVPWCGVPDGAGVQTSVPAGRADTPFQDPTD